jgi:hypothetical protein
MAIRKTKKLFHSKKRTMKMRGGAKGQKPVKVSVENSGQAPGKRPGGLFRGWSRGKSGTSKPVTIPSQSVTIPPWDVLRLTTNPLYNSNHSSNGFKRPAMPLPLGVTLFRQPISSQNYEHRLATIKGFSKNHNQFVRNLKSKTVTAFFNSNKTTLAQKNAFIRNMFLTNAPINPITGKKQHTREGLQALIQAAQATNLGYDNPKSIKNPIYDTAEHTSVTSPLYGPAETSSSSYLNVGPSKSSYITVAPHTIANTKYMPVAPHTMANSTYMQVRSDNANAKPTYLNISPAPRPQSNIYITAEPAAAPAAAAAPPLTPKQIALNSLRNIRTLL